MEALRDVMEALWDDTEHYRVSLYVMEPVEVLWGIADHYGTLWSVAGHYESYGTLLEHFGAFTVRNIMEPLRKYQFCPSLIEL